ncbi:hypothetical protein BCR44DRAFT_1428368 [Catenaria anguillulae PL171]|uniref:Uncharacterized protein n=1 Tax=Catenaria anguillulae PL171 TaxID=765915 RepID=A0A1Y2HXM4_9FUNG|nr:hypothetical protein BCR44DRAFT_1428368 [Catenaria anguillulae PL171]
MTSMPSQPTTAAQHCGDELKMDAVPNYTIAQSLHWAFNIHIPNPFRNTWTPTPQEQVILNETCERVRSVGSDVRGAYLIGCLVLYAANFRQFRSRFSIVTIAAVYTPLVGLAAQSVPAWQGYRQVRMLPNKNSAFNQQRFRFRHFSAALFFAQMEMEVEAEVEGNK